MQDHTHRQALPGEGGGETLIEQDYIGCAEGHEYPYLQVEFNVNLRPFFVLS